MRALILWNAFKNSVMTMASASLSRAWAVRVSLLLSSFIGAHALAQRDYRPSTDYVADISDERSEKEEDLILVNPPADISVDYRNKIFTDQLTREFSERYRQIFGYTEAEQAYYAPNRFTFYNDLYGFQGTPEENNDARRQFGEYMVRRLLEFHVDNYAKSDPAVRPLWEAKERLSAIKVEIKKFRFDFRYSLSGNTAELYVYNPYADVKATVQMNPGAFGPGPVNETILGVTRNITKYSSLESHYYMIDGVFSIIGKDKFSDFFSGTMTVSTFTLPVGTTPRESLYLAGLSYGF